jgi:hypothetical protein
MSLEPLNLSLCTRALGVGANYDSGEELYYMVLDRDGNARWLFAASLKKPLFLETYNVISFRSRVLFFLFRFAFMTGVLQRFMAVKVYAPVVMNDVAFFLGTVGPNRKIVKVSREKGTTFFEKIPFGENSLELIKKERSMLQTLQFLNTPFLSPTLCETGFLKTQKLPDSEGSLRDSRNQVWELCMNISELWLLPQKHPLVQQAEEAMDIATKDLLSDISMEDVKFGFGHGDLTPWNVKGVHPVGVFDWEMSGSYPVLYDWFHYHIQTAVMEGLGAKEIQLLVEERISAPRMRA